MTSCDQQCQINVQGLPTICLDGFLLIFIIVMIYKTTIQYRLFNFVLAMLTVLAVAATASEVTAALGYKILSLEVEINASGT